jgi:Kdo2-lipid IVA lauroyltransferase/acyltransferase
MARKKNTFLIYFEFLAILPVVISCRILPVRLGYYIADFISLLFFIFDRKHRNRVIKHLIFAGVCKNKKEAKKMGRENFRQFGYLAIEILKTKQLITPETISNHVSFAGSQTSIDMFFESETPTNAIVLTAHYGNWEIAAFIYTLMSGHHLLSVMRIFDNPLIGKHIAHQRLGFDHSLCPKKGAMKPLMKTLRNGDSVSIVVDQHAGRNEGVETKFFGKDARTHASPAMLHLKTGVPILVGITKRIGIFKFKVFVADPIIMKPTGDKEGDILKLTQEYTTALEKLIRENGPEQWLWAHRRWLDHRKKTVRTSQNNM